MTIKKALFIFTSAILLGFFMILPFNLVCKATNWCEPISLSYYLPSFSGEEQFEIFFEAKDSSPSLNIEAKERSTVIKTGEKRIVQYSIMNPNFDTKKVAPRLYIIPQEAAKYLKFYECLCFREHKIEGYKIKNLNVKFKLDRKIESDKFFENNRIIRVGYEIK